MARTWHHVSARNATLGKVAVDIATKLMGKHKPIYDQSADHGDYVVVTDARHVHVTGRKSEQKLYRHHTMYPGGLKEIPYSEMMQRKPDQVCLHGFYLFSSCLTMTRRLFAEPCLGCCRRTSFVIGD